ncbi:MAG: hypothetical protein COB49_02965 [Alphaproteobacteria bacterium]|nr:MAG: hypothetical protein COB49_02965 [Alphaproteobacteria bacterium]
MKKYCLDTSGISNPWGDLPHDIFNSLWENIEELIVKGIFAVTLEIYEEQLLIPNPLGEIIKVNKNTMLLEIGQDDWNWPGYIEISNDLNGKYNNFISEYTGRSPRTIGLNDMTIIALAKTLNLPVVSMEVSSMNSLTKRKIPDICKLENVGHLTFNELLRAEKIKL